VVLLRIDEIEAAMRRNGLRPDQTGITATSRYPAAVCDPVELSRYP
jgi:hypothetical protein